MKLFFSRANYDRVTAGMTAAERAEFDQTAVVYPDDLYEPESTINQDRIAARFAELLWAAARAAPAERDGWFISPRANGEDSVVLPEPWEQVGPGLWYAPAGTPPPWVNVDDLVDEIRADEEDSAARKALMGQVFEVRRDVPPSFDASAHDAWQACPPLGLGEMNDLIRRHQETSAPGPRRLEAGDAAHAAITAATPPAGPRDWRKDVHNAAASLTRIPIVPNDTLAPNDWRLVNPTTGEVLHEGTVGPDLTEYIRVVKEYAVELADKAGIPRHYLL